MNKIDDEAFRWVVRQETGPLSTEEQGKLDAWLAQSRRHHGAYIRAHAVILYCKRVGSLGRGVPLSSLQRDLANPGRRRLLTAAASVTTVAGVGLWLGRGWIEELESSARYVTRVGEMRSVVLADASELLLNTATEVLVRYGHGAREVRLLHGEALFTVAQALRPFTVHVGDWVLLTANATFAVRDDATGIDLKVKGGDVEAQPRSGNATSQRLTGNQEASLREQGVAEVRTVRQAELDRRLAWRKGLVIFDGESVREAVAQMNRYTTRKIELEGLPIFEQPVVGVFHSTDTAPFVAMLERQLGVHAVERGNEIVLRY
jgi:transmembrane sensor